VLFTGLLVLSLAGQANGKVSQTRLSPDPIEGPIVGRPEAFGVSRPVRNLAPAPSWKPGQPIRFVPNGPPSANGAPAIRASEGVQPSTGHRSPDAPSRLSSAAFDDPTPTPERNFPGIGFTGFLPPDPNGDVGPNHYVQAVNTQFQVFDKTGGSTGPRLLSSLYATLPATSLCRTDERGDPVVLYDQLADRWLISSFAFDVVSNSPVPPFEQCIAVSQTADPTGAYFVYDFNIHNTKFPDYPKLGVWPVAMTGSAQGAYFMSTNQFGGAVPPDAFTDGGGAYAFNRTQMLAGNPLTTFLYFDTPERQMLPSDLDGGTQPPAGTPSFFIKFVDGTPDRLEVRSFTANFTTPALSTFALTDTVATAAFDSDMCGGFFQGEQCIPQPPPPSCTSGGNDMSGVNPGCRLASIPDRLLFRAAYRNFAGTQTLVVNHTVDVGDFADHAGIMWHELRSLTGPGGWTMFQEGVHSPDATHRWMGSIAMNGDRDIAVGYSASSATISPGIRYAARQVGDAAGTMQTEATLIAGGGSQTLCQAVDTSSPPDGVADFCRGRWGDYSSMSVDPVDDCTFWYTQQYIPSATGRWATRIGAFRFPSCVPAISINDVSQAEGNAGTTAFAFTISLSQPSAFPTTVDFTTADGTATTADNDYQATSGTVTVPLGTTSEIITVLVNGDITVEPDESFFVNLTNPTDGTIADGQGQGTILNDDLSADVPCTITGTNGDDLLVGTPGDDVICGLDGNDEIHGLGGNDVLIGGNGQDILLGGEGHDLLLGGNGLDELQGGTGNDNLQGGTGNDTLVGGAGSDALFGDNGVDSLDTQDGVEGNDSADGGLAPDTCTTDPADATINCP
jgi:Ca2+-binding RTX toxin-like protein